MIFLLLNASVDNSGLFVDSPYCRYLCYDNRASKRTCPCKPLLTLSIIAVMGKKSNSGERRLCSNGQDVGLASSLPLPLPPHARRGASGRAAERSYNDPRAGDIKTKHNVFCRLNKRADVTSPSLWDRQKVKQNILWRSLSSIRTFIYHRSVSSASKVLI